MKVIDLYKSEKTGPFGERIDAEVRCACCNRLITNVAVVEVGGERRLLGQACAFQEGTRLLTIVGDKPSSTDKYKVLRNAAFSNDSVEAAARRYFKARISALPAA